MSNSGQVFTTVVISGPSGVGKTTIGKWLARELRGPFVEGDDYHPAKNIEKMRSGSPLTDSDRAPWLERLHRDVVQRGSKGLWNELKNSPYRSASANGHQGPAGASNTTTDPTAPSSVFPMGKGNETAMKGNFLPPSMSSPYFPPPSDNPPAVVVLACSALKRTYRDILRGNTNDANNNTPSTPAVTSSGLPSVPSRVIFIFLDGDRELLRRRLAQRTGHFMPPSLLQSQLDTLEFLTPDENGCVIDFSFPPEKIIREAKNTVALFMKRPVSNSPSSVL